MLLQCSVAAWEPCRVVQCDVRVCGGNIVGFRVWGLGFSLQFVALC